MTMKKFGHSCCGDDDGDGCDDYDGCGRGDGRDENGADANYYYYFEAGASVNVNFVACFESGFDSFDQMIFLVHHLHLKQHRRSSELLRLLLLLLQIHQLKQSDHSNSDQLIDDQLQLLSKWMHPHRLLALVRP